MMRLNPYYKVPYLCFPRFMRLLLTKLVSEYPQPNGAGQYRICKLGRSKVCVSGELQLALFDICCSK